MLNLFARINLASCAMKRAEHSVLKDDIFQGEWETARAWTKYRCYISTKCSFVEID